MVLVLYQEGFPAVIQEDRGTIPGNSQRCNTEYKFPRRRQRRSWRPGITPDTGMGVVLEAWCYTRAGGPEWSTWRRLDSREFPNCVARYKFPRRRRRLDLYQQQQGSLIPAGLRHLYQGSVGDGKRWITGIQGSHGVIDLFVYTSSILVSCLYRHLILTVYTRRVILITPMPLRR